MHLALAKKLFCCVNEIGGGLLAPGRRLAHACCALWNAGAWGLMLAGRSTLPFGLRSGKLGTPWERMQSEYATPCGEEPAVVVLTGRDDDPQAAINAAEVTATNATDTRRHVHPGVTRCGRSTTAEMGD
jgi:hypothetical protein